MKISSNLRHVFLFCLLSFSISSARAQYVSIPDTSFGLFLYSHGYDVIGNSTSGWLLNIQDSAVVNETGIDCAGAGISDLTGIQYFTGLNYIFAMGNQITNLSTLPSSLRILNCSSNLLTTLPALPLQIETLNCNGNQLSVLPAIPATVTYLDFGSNNIITPPAIPSGLLYLDCSTNPLSALPVLPVSLSALICYGDGLDSLPVLPPHLQGLQCSYNHLTAIPPLSTSLINLDCSYNPSLYCLPHIYPNSLYEFIISGTHITCLPNRFTATIHSSDPATMPLCDATTGCDFYYNIAGTVHIDTSASCSSDSLYPGAPVTNIKVQLLQGGNVVQQFYTFNSGGYSFRTPSPGSYTVSIDTASLPITVVCPQSVVRSLSLTAIDTVRSHEGFGMQCSTTSPFGINAIVSDLAHPFRPAVTTDISVLAGNLSLMQHNISCASAAPGSVTVTYSGPVLYTTPAAGALTPSVSGTTLTYQISDLNALSPDSIGLLFSTDNTAIPGTPIYITATITDGVHSDTLTEVFFVHDSHDPNLKEVYPTTLTSDGDWLTYTVHFQNTGTDTAYLVVLRDTLSSYVDASSFQYLASSHHAVIQLFGSAMVFTFPKINLVDSATNPPLSEGWIQYRVKTNHNLPNGTAINNTAYIYFDQNTAIVTNTATTQVSVATCIDTTINLGIFICQGDTFMFDNISFTSSAVFNDTLHSVGGCDSIIALNLTVNPSYITATADTICSGGSFAFYGRSLTTQGTYYDTLHTVNGCDSIITLDLSVNPSYTNTIADTICSGLTYVFYGDTLTAPGAYSDTLHTLNGCDSIITLNLSVRQSPIVTLTWQDMVQKRYLWANPYDTIWCNFFPFISPLSGGMPLGGTYHGDYIQNDTIKFFNLHYRFPYNIDTITYTYTDSAGCVGIAVDSIRLTVCEGINDITDINAIHLYPNPNNGTFTLQTTNSEHSAYIVTDMLGHVIGEGEISSDTQAIDMSDAAAGVYTLVVRGAQASRPIRFTVVR